VNNFCVITREQKKRHNMSLEFTQSEFSNGTERLSFHKACDLGNLKVVKVYLAQLGFDMNVRDDGGETGFHGSISCSKRI